jgi:hypothetical protein
VCDQIALSLGNFNDPNLRARGLREVTSRSQSRARLGCRVEANTDGPDAGGHARVAGGRNGERAVQPVQEPYGDVACEGLADAPAVGRTDHDDVRMELLSEPLETLTGRLTRACLGARPDLVGRALKLREGGTLLLVVAPFAFR